MNLEHIISRILEACGFTGEQKAEICEGIQGVIEKEVLYRVSLNERLAANLQRNDQALLTDITQALQEDSEYQKIYQESVLTIISDWVADVSPSLPDKNKKQLQAELESLAQAL